MGYDQGQAEPGRSKEVDAVAYAAAREVNNPGFKTNSEDPINTYNTPQGNPEDPEFNKGRTLTGSK